MIVEKATFHAALKAVVPVTKDNRTIPILTHVVLARSAGRLLVRGNNLDLEIAMTIDADFEDGFEDIACPGAQLDEFVKAAPGPEIEVTLQRTGGKVTSLSLASGHSKLRLMTLSASDLPSLETGPLEHGFTIDGHIFAKALNAVIYAASTDKSRTYLHGAFIEPTPQGLAVVATDGYRIERRLVPIMAFDDNDTLADLPPTILPTATVSRLLALVADGKDLTLQVSDTKLRATVGNTTLLSGLVDGVFPDYRRAVPQLGEFSASFSTAALLAALTRVRIAITEKTKRVHLIFSEGSLLLKAKDDALGEAQDQIDAKSSGPFEIGFNLAFLKELIEHSGVETIEICASDPSVGARFRGRGDEESFAVLMPLRI